MKDREKLELTVRRSVEDRTHARSRLRYAPCTQDTAPLHGRGAPPVLSAATSASAARGRCRKTCDRTPRAPAHSHAARRARRVSVRCHCGEQGGARSRALAGCRARS